MPIPRVKAAYGKRQGNGKEASRQRQRSVKEGVKEGMWSRVDTGCIVFFIVDIQTRMNTMVCEGGLMKELSIF